jgi:hypothetical protein
MNKTASKKQHNNMDGTESDPRALSPKDPIVKVNVKKETISPEGEWVTTPPEDTGNSVQNDAGNDPDNDADSDADNDAGNSKKDILIQKFLRELKEIVPAPSAVAEQDNVDIEDYDCLECARTIKGNWKIIAPTLTAVSGVAAIGLLTIGARGSVSDVQLSLGARWGTWIAGYLMTQATIIIGTSCIPSIHTH